MSDSEGDTFCDTLEQMEPEKVTEEALEAFPSLPRTDISAQHRQPGSLTKPAGTPLHLSVLRVTAGAWSLSQRGCRGASPGPHCCGVALVGHWGLLGLGQTSSSTGVPGLLCCHFSLLPAAMGHVWHSRCHGEAWWIWWKEGGSPPSFAISCLGTSLPSGVLELCHLPSQVLAELHSVPRTLHPQKCHHKDKRRTPLLPWHPPPCPGEGSGGLRALLSHLIGWAGAGAHPKRDPGWG